MSNSDQKADYLRECMSDPALVQKPLPIDQFSQMFCVVCGQKVCARSRASNMIFTERVATWKERLFDKVPRAADNDENYSRIRAKNFKNIEAPISIGQKPLPTFEPLEENPHSESSEVSEEKPQIVIVESKEVPAPFAAPRQTEPQVLVNTPFGAGVTLPGKPVDNKIDVFIEPGGSFTFGDDDDK
jgi:hypothetical protein